MEWGTLFSGVSFFCFHALEDTKLKKPTPLDRGYRIQCKQGLSESIAFLSFAEHEILSKGAWKTVEASSSFVSSR